MIVKIPNSADAARTAMAFAWWGAVTPRRQAGFDGIRRGVRVSAIALLNETAPPD